MQKEKISLCSFWSKEKLIQRCEEIGERAFARGFRQKAISSEELTFSHFKQCIKYGETMPQWQYSFTGVDLSSTTRPGVVIITIGISGDLALYPIDIRIGAWSSPETAEQIKDVYEKYKSPAILIEDNAYQSSLIEWMQTKNFKNIPIVPFTTGLNKRSIEIGLPALDVQFERNMWKIYAPEHQTGCNCNWCRLIREFKSHPGYSTSDCVMAFWFAERAYNMYGIKRSKEYKENPKTKPITAGLRNNKKSLW